MLLKVRLILVVLLLLFGCKGVDGFKNGDSENYPIKVKNYDTLGIYNVKRYPEQGLSDEYVVYATQEDSIKADMPVVLFLVGGNSHVSSYPGIMQFLASKGYYVIGSDHGGSYNSNETYNVFNAALYAARSKYHLNLSKIVVMGHSQGGGQAFYVMKKFQDKGFGREASLVLSIDGWFAFSMNQSDLRALQGEVVFIQMNGLVSTGTDPRIDLTIWNLANQTDRTFLILPENNHGYVTGALDNLLNNKKDLLYIIGAMTDDVFTDKATGYESIPEENKSSYEEIYNALRAKDTYSGDCYGRNYNAREGQLKYYDINYCTPEKYKETTTGIR